MSDLIHADVFFFITSIAVVVITALFLVIFFYVVRILRDVRHITDVGRRKAEQLSEDLDMVREHIKKGAVLSGIVKFFTASAKWFGKTSKKKSGQAK